MKYKYSKTTQNRLIVNTCRKKIKTNINSRIKGVITVKLLVIEKDSHGFQTY